MKVAFILQFNQPEIGGLFFSSTSRIKYFIKKNKDIDVCVFNIRAKPGLFIRILRYLITKGEQYE